MQWYFGHIPNFMEISLHLEDHQGANEDPEKGTSLCIPGQETELLGSIEEHNAAFFTTLVRNQSLTSRVPHVKDEVAETNERKGIPKSILVRHLSMMLEAW